MEIGTFTFGFIAGAIAMVVVYILTAKLPLDDS
jgi:hypothetical protein